MSTRTQRPGHQLELEAEVNQSHLPDLSERLIDAHRLLQMSREYLLPLAVDNRAFNHACDNILDAMGDIELAIAKLKE